MTRPFLWAHRGASCCSPENTMTAFAAAVESGADGLELDIHLSRDGIPVIIHDETLERTTNGRGLVAGKTWRQLQQFEAGGWFSAEFAGESIPSLEEVLQTFGGQLKLNLELKEFRAGMAVLDLLSLYPSAEIVVSSFNVDLLKSLRSVKGDLPLAVLFDSGNWRHAVRVSKDLSACAFHPMASLVTRPMIAACRQAGLSVSVWTVDRASVAKSLVRAGISGLFTNDPAKLKALFRSSPFTA
ncbi:MAG: glycerophosphodiester phosphodiesterase [Desulfuromonadales bacterium]